MKDVTAEVVTVTVHLYCLGEEKKAYKTDRIKVPVTGELNFTSLEGVKPFARAIREKYKGCIFRTGLRRNKNKAGELCVSIYE